MKESSSFGALLKRYRLEAGLSQEALAARAELSTRAISDLERGVKHTPRFETCFTVGRRSSRTGYDF